MKLITLLILFSLFAVTSCKNKKAQIDEKEEGNKIQKNSAFKPACQSSKTVTCNTGNPACGTEPGAGELKIYCIDENDIILSDQPICGITEADDDYSAHCTQLTETSPDEIRIVDTATHTPVCIDISNETTSTVKPKCTFGNSKIICGKRPGDNIINLYCVDENNMVQVDYPTCESSPQALLSPKCKTSPAAGE